MFREQLPETFWEQFFIYVDQNTSSENASKNQDPTKICCQAGLTWNGKGYGIFNNKLTSPMVLICDIRNLFEHVNIL